MPVGHSTKDRVWINVARRLRLKFMRHDNPTNESSERKSKNNTIGFL